VDPEIPWASASDLAEYTYCPRAYWYRTHPPPGEVPRGTQRRAEAGTRYHTRELRSEGARESNAGAYLVLVGIGLVLLAAVGVWVWSLR
jgi:CRISPR/Cas system-associated exonuclease Cas4 (RecB family)